MLLGGRHAFAALPLYGEETLALRGRNHPLAAGDRGLSLAVTYQALDVTSVSWYSTQGYIER